MPKLPQLFYDHDYRDTVPSEWLLSQAFLRGVHAFTTIRLSPNGIEFLGPHLARLEYSISKLYPHFLSQWPAVKKDLMDFFNRDDLKTYAPVSVRISLIDQGKTLKWVAILRAMGTTPEFLQVAFVKDQRRHQRDSRMKLADYSLEHELLQQNAQADEIVFEDSKWGLLSGSIHSLFVLREETLYLPEPEAGVLQGVYQQAFIKKWQDTNGKIKRQGIKSSELQSNDLLILSNCLRGLRLASEKGISLNEIQKLRYKELQVLEKEMIHDDQKTN